MASDFGSTRVDRSLLVRARRATRALPLPPARPWETISRVGCPLSRRCSPPAPSPRPPSQDDAFEGYRLAKDLLPDDACETIAIDPPALDAPASASADRVAQLASARRNVLVQLHALPDADGTRFAFANASGGFTSVDVTHDLDTRTRVATLTPALPPAPPRPAPAPGARERPSLGPSVAAFRVPSRRVANLARRARRVPRGGRPRRRSRDRIRRCDVDVDVDSRRRSFRRPVRPRRRRSTSTFRD